MDKVMPMRRLVKVSFEITFEKVYSVGLLWKLTINAYYKKQINKYK